MTALRRFDTLKSYNALKRSGISDNQAETLVEMIKEATDSSIEHLATKEDLINTKAELKEDIASVKIELKEDNASLRVELKEDNASLRVELKEDIASLRVELKEDNASVRAELAAVKTELKEDFAELKGNVNILTKFMFGFCIVVVINMVFFWLHH